MKTLHVLVNPGTILAMLFFCLLGTSSQAQSSDLCTDDDCSPSVLAIKLDAPLQPSPAGVYTPQRTQQFKTAYLSLKQAKKGYTQNSSWQAKNDGGLLVGPSCLRQYQLESSFVYEYEQNPEFKKFIDQNEADVEAFKENGFESSRRALNLTRRMESNCPSELKKAEKAPGAALDNLPEVYRKMGRVLGYFDENNQMLKPFKSEEKKALSNRPANPAKSASNTADNTEPKLSKKEQIAQLKDKVTKLPIGQPMKDKISGIAGDLKSAKPKLGLLGGLLGGLLKSKLAAFLPGPLGLLAKIKAGLGIIKALNIFKPKKPKPELAAKIDNLNKKGEDLAKKAQEAVDKANQLQETLNKLSDKTADLQKEIEQREAKIAEMDQTLADLDKKKAELAAELEDNPRRQLEEIKPQVDNLTQQSEELVQKAEAEKQDKDKLLDQVEEVSKQKDQLESDLQKQETELQNIAKESEQLQAEAQATNAEVEAVKEAEAKEEAVEELKEKIDALPAEEKYQEEIKLCENDLAILLKKIKGLDETQQKVKKKVGDILAFPEKLLGKVADLKIVQNTLKLGKKGIPLADKALKKVDELLNKSAAIGSIVEVITGKKSRFQEKIEGFDQKLGKIQETFNAKTANLDNLKAELFKLVAEKTGLKGKLGQQIEDVKTIKTAVEDFITRYDVFDKKVKCPDKTELETKVEDLNKEQASIEPEAQQLEQELKEVAQQEEKLEFETKAVEQEIEETTQKVEELKQEEKAIKEEFGKDVTLQPVQLEEWAESFEVERPYWEAVFHPDEEVVEGYKGRYFEVKLKDADKNVKLQFAPGEYFMDKSAFRKNYGTTIGAFVKEALHNLKKADESKVIVFIQGSADITGDKTFTGKLDDRFPFQKISVLPQKNEPERFSGQAVEKETPMQNFKNNHLPNLRAQYLKEMISVYSKKIDPVLLDGVVKKYVSKEERNAVIYLFFPEELLSRDRK
ncbi:hypothetical protein [Haliscomenobacter sp.]|uniref:hypothetical protein n=1 Tax=Haliscomenobacter sp. TaxID=2717303 RepID=UPI003593AAA6